LGQVFGILVVGISGRKNNFWSNEE